MLTNPSRHAVTKQSERKTRDVRRSCEIFLHISGCSIGVSDNRGQQGWPSSLTGSSESLCPSLFTLFLSLLREPRLKFRLWSFLHETASAGFAAAGVVVLFVIAVAFVVAEFEEAECTSPTLQLTGDDLTT